MASITIEEAGAIKARFEPAVLRMPGVTGVDLGSGSAGALAIRVYVASLAAAPPLPTSVEGLAVEVIERRFGLQADR